MNPPEWTIENELQKLTNTNTIDDAISSLKLLPEGLNGVRIETYKDWERGGAETYIFPFCIITSQGLRSELLLKAVVAYSPSRTIDDILNNWVAKRRLLESAGVSTPQLFFAGKGVLLEQFIQYSLADLLGSSLNKDALIDQVFCYAGVLGRFRFNTIEAFNDLRTDGQSVFVIDFGEDMGTPNSVDSKTALLLYKSAQEWVKKNSGNKNIDYHRSMAMFHLGYDDGYMN